MIKSPIPLAESAKTHAEFMRKVRKLAKGTISGYMTTYNTLIAHLEGMTEPVIPLADVPLTTDLLNPELIIDFFVNYVGEVCNDGTYAVKLSHVRTVIKWHMTHGYIEWGANPVDLLGDRKSDYKPARVKITDSEWMATLKVATARHPRDRSLLLLARVLPRRINEILDLQWGDIDWQEKDICYDNTKARKYGELMPLDPEAWAILEAWKAIYEEETGPVRRTWYIFPAFNAAGFVKRGRTRDVTLAPSSIISNPSRLIRDHLKDAGVYRRQMGWHSLRRATGNAVRQVARAGGRGDSLDLAKEALSHSSTDTTTVYMDIDVEYEVYKDWRMENRLIPDEMAAQIPELAHLVSAGAVEPQAPEPAAVSSPGDRSNVISLLDRRRTAS